MDREIQEKIDLLEFDCRFSHDIGIYVTCDPKVILDIFAAFRLEIIKAGGRNA